MVGFAASLPFQRKHVGGRRVERMCQCRTPADVYRKEPLAVAVRDFWSSRNLDRYDANEYHIQLAEDLVSFVKPQPGDTVLDLATGTGIVSRALAEQVSPHGQVVGMDLTGATLEKALERRQETATYENISYVNGDVESQKDLERTVEAAGGKFDLITCVSSLPYFSDVKSAVPRWISVLKDTGRLALTGIDTKSVVAGVVLRLACEKNGIHLPEWSQDTADAQACEELLTSCGLSKVSVIAVDYGEEKPVAELAAAYDSLESMGNHPLTRQLAEIPLELRRSIRDDYREMIVQRGGGLSTMFDSNNNFLFVGQR